MSKTHRYVLVLDTHRHGSSGVHSLLAQLRCPVYIAGTVEQALAKVHQAAPYLVILIGDGQNWSQPLVEQLRQGARTTKMTIVALTDSASPRWGYQDENPGLDGFLVKPLSGEVLTSLVESALAKQDSK